MIRLLGFWFICVIILASAGCGRKEEEPPPAPAELPEVGDPVPAEVAVAPPAEDPVAVPDRTALPRPARPELTGEDIARLISQAEEGLRAETLSLPADEPNPLVLLGRSRSPEAIDVLSRVLLSSADPLARRQASRSLGLIPDDAALPPLRQSLGDEYIWVRLTSALGLARRGEAEAALPIFSEIIYRRGIEDWKIETGEPAVFERSEEERERIETNLARLKEQTLPLLALSGLEAISSPEALEIVRAALESENPQVRRRAERILESVEP